MNDLAKSVRNVMTVFLVLFIALISYIAYFQLIKSPKINDMPGNTRVMAVKNEVLRGTIYDRDGNALTTSERINDTSQKRDYLYGDLYVHALGYTSAVYGTTGLEEEYDSENDEWYDARHPRLTSGYYTVDGGKETYFEDISSITIDENIYVGSEVWIYGNFYEIADTIPENEFGCRVVDDSGDLWKFVIEEEISGVTILDR